MVYKIFVFTYTLGDKIDSYASSGWTILPQMGRPYSPDFFGVIRSILIGECLKLACYQIFKSDKEIKFLCIMYMFYVIKVNTLYPNNQTDEILDQKRYYKQEHRKRGNIRP